MQDREFLTETEVAWMIGMTRGGLAKNRRAGVGPAYIRIRHRIRYQLRDVRTWLEARKQTPEQVKAEKEGK